MNARTQLRPLDLRDAVPTLDPLAAQLVDQALLTTKDAFAAQTSARRRKLPLANILIASHGISARAVATIQAEQHRCSLVDPTVDVPDPRLMKAYGLKRAMAHRLLPWRLIGGQVIVLVCCPLVYDDHLLGLVARFGSVRMALTTQDQFDRCISCGYGQALAINAEEMTPARLSCRNWQARRAMIAGSGVAAVLVSLAIWQPTWVFVALTSLAITFLVLNSMLKIAALWMLDPLHKDDNAVVPIDLPKFTVLIPLHDETAIADHLLCRLQAIDYPPELLDICLVLEASDKTTRHAIGQAKLPTWMRSITVPDGQLKTKPRAMNYALGFAHGSVIGIYDAEDAPAPDQLRKVAAHFAQCREDVACLQGTLDYYNADSSWLTRCFTMEYASWFRVMLPGLAKMGFVVPLGGTTLFFKRDILEDLGAWDAHNVTEDADLGVRLARYGYRTEFVHTITQEEANGRFWPWVKQRSRWLKGYAITYGVHMRNPRQLVRDLGLWRFFGLQMLFAGTLLPFLLAPVLLSFWLIPFGIAHPLTAVVPKTIMWAMGLLFFGSELLNISIAAVAVRRAEKGWLVKWTPTLQFYFPLATVAAYKGLLELTWKPFYWDKTAHGIFKASRPVLQPPPRPTLDGSRKPH